MYAFLQNVAFDSFKEALISSDLNLGKYAYFCSSVMSIATLNFSQYPVRQLHWVIA